MFGRDTEQVSRRQALRVLVIENDESFGQVLSGMLTQARETVGGVVTVGNLADGLERIARENFCVILLEFFLPDGAGLTNIAVLQDVAPLVPVIVIGSADDETLAIEAVHAGAQDYLVKNQINPNWLLRSIRYTIERHEADLALFRAEEKYHGIFDHLVEGIFQTTPEGRYLLANSALARIYGYGSPEELMSAVTDIGQRLYVAPGQREEFRRIMDQHDTITGFESQIFRKDGSIIWISENCRAIRNARGQLQYYEGTVEDITLRRDAQENLRASEALYHSLVDTMPQSIFRKDLQGRYTFSNKQFCRVVGLPAEEILGKTIFDIYPADLAEKRQADDWRVMSTGQPFQQIELNYFPGRENEYIHVLKIPIFDLKGQIIGLQGMFWDITEQKLAEQRIRQANAELAASREELRAKHQEMEDDLKMAREVQVAMLPQQYPTVPRGVSPEDSVFQFVHRYHPSGEVGGDFFSVAAISDLEVAVFICDVAGHGVRSSLITAMIRALVEELRPHAHDPGQFMTKLNAEIVSILKHSGEAVLTTAFYLVANAATSQMQYANAGHPKPLLVRRTHGTVEQLKSIGKKSQPALGLFEQAAYETSEIKLAPRDLLLLFTDGVFEVESVKEELFSQEALATVVRKYQAAPAASLIDSVLSDIREFAAQHVFEDDVCLLGIECFAANPTPKREPPTKLPGQLGKS